MQILLELTATYRLDILNVSDCWYSVLALVVWLGYYLGFSVSYLGIWIECFLSYTLKIFLEMLSTPFVRSSWSIYPMFISTNMLVVLCYFCVGYTDWQNIFQQFSNWHLYKCCQGSGKNYSVFLEIQAQCLKAELKLLSNGTNFLYDITLLHIFIS